MKLKPRGRYSPTEQAIFSLLPKKKGEGVIADEMIGPVYRGDPPDTARGSLSAALRSLAKKIELNEEPFCLKRTRRRGPYPVEWWLEKRTNAKKENAA